MKHKKWKKHLKMALAQFREDNMSSYRKSPEYLESSRNLDAAYKELDDLRLSKKENRVISKVLNASTSLDAGYVEAAYLQGLQDGIRLLQDMQFTG